MTRSIVLALAFLFLAPCIALAQATHHAPRVDPELALSLEPSQAAELASIDTESHVATGLYVTAVALHVGGIGMAVGGAIAGFCIDFGGGGCSDAHARAEPWEIGGLVVAGIGLLTFIPAIVLDVDSGHRRDRLRGGHVAFSIGAGGVGLEGSF